MSEAFQAPVGTHDVLGAEAAQWEGVIATFAQLAYRYGFSMIVTPVFEEVEVFNRGIGEKSEVATKEMYVFEDRGGRTFALREPPPLSALSFSTIPPCRSRPGISPRPFVTSAHKRVAIGNTTSSV